MATHLPLWADRGYEGFLNHCRQHLVASEAIYVRVTVPDPGVDDGGVPVVSQDPAMQDFRSVQSWLLKDEDTGALAASVFYSENIFIMFDPSPSGKDRTAATACRFIAQGAPTAFLIRKMQWNFPLFDRYGIEEAYVRNVKTILESCPALRYVRLYFGGDQSIVERDPEWALQAVHQLFGPVNGIPWNGVTWEERVIIIPVPDLLFVEIEGWREPSINAMRNTIQAILDYGWTVHLSDGLNNTRTILSARDGFVVETA